MAAASKIALGAAVTLFSTAIIGYMGYRLCRKHENTDALPQKIEVTKQLCADKPVVGEPAPCKPCLQVLNE